MTELRPEGFQRVSQALAARGHVFKLSPDELVQLTGAPVADVVQQP